MARCRECRAYNVKISGTSSRRSFVFTCVNPRCRITYVQTLGIADDLVPVLTRRSVPRRLLDAAGNTAEMESAD